MSKFPEPWGNYLLKELIETTAPKMTSFWPQTIGWQVIAVLLLLALIRKSYLAWQAYKRNAYRREALAWLNHLPVYISLNEQPIYRQLPALLRKTALQAFGRDQVSHLSNEHWEHWLDQQCDKTSFSEQYTSYLHPLAYAPQLQLEAQQMKNLLHEINLWIKFHRRLDD